MIPLPAKQISLDSPFNGNVHSMQCKKLKLKSNCIEFCNSTTYSIECKSDLGRLTVYHLGRTLSDTSSLEISSRDVAGRGNTVILDCSGGRLEQSESRKRIASTKKTNFHTIPLLCLSKKYTYLRNFATATHASVCSLLDP
jgi:hypothetical protein